MCNKNMSKLLCNFIEIAVRYGCSPVNLLHILRTSFPKKIYGGLLLKRWQKSYVIFEKILARNVWYQRF